MGLQNMGAAAQKTPLTLMYRFPPRRQWDDFPLLGVGKTAQVRAVSAATVLKVAHPDPDSRARLQREALLNRKMLAAGLPVARVFALRGKGIALLRERVEGRTLQKPHRAVFQLWLRVHEFEARHEVRVDFTPNNLRWTSNGPVLFDSGERGVPPVFRSQTWSGFVQEWNAYFRRRVAPRLEPMVMPPSGRFHVEVPVGPDRRSKVLWVNRGLLGRMGLKWSERFLHELGNWSTQSAPTTTRVATRYADMIALDLKNGPRGDGRSVYLGRILGRELTLKGCGPTPLAWVGRQFHEDGLVSLPRTLWEVTAADELARLGFDVPEYLAVLSVGKKVFDNTQKWWPAAKGIRIASSHFRLGHLRRFASDPTALRALIEQSKFAGPVSFARNLGRDIGRTDALQIHGFNPTPGNVRLDGHLIDFSTVRFLRDYLPDFKFLENVYAVRIHRRVWWRLCNMLIEILGDESKREATLRAYARAYESGFAEELGRFFGFRRPRACAALVNVSQKVRALRRPETVHLRYWKQSCPAPRFDFLGRAPEFTRAVRRGDDEPWRALLAYRHEELSSQERRLVERWVKIIAPLIRRSKSPARRWSEVIRPSLEPEALAQVLYVRKQNEKWKELIATSKHLPEGNYQHKAAVTWAQRLGHVELPTLDGVKVRRVIGLTPELHHGIQRVLRKALGSMLVGAVAHGSRVMERSALEREYPELIGASDWPTKRGIREFGPSPALSSDLDLKIFIRGKSNPRLERNVGEALASLGAWFPFTAHVPPRQRLISTRRSTLRSAFTEWNGAPRLREMGKTPIHSSQVVALTE